MTAYLTLARRELAAYFLSITGYVIMAGVTFLVGYSFVVLILQLRETPTPMPITEMFFQTQFFWLVLLLACPAITMRLFAQEKFSGTFETLMTTPVSDHAVVLAKFSAALVFYMVTWLPLIGCLYVVRRYTNEPAAFDTGAVVSTFTGLFLIGCLFISAGTCASAVTRNQVVAAVISLVFAASLFLLAFLADELPQRLDWSTRVLACFAFFRQLHDFSRGIIDTRPVVLYLTLTFFFLFLTLRIVESRRWK